MTLSSLATETPPDRELISGTLIMAGKAPAAQIRRECAEEIAALRARFGLLPGLAVLRVGSDPSSVSYAGRILQAFSNAGLAAEVYELPANAGRSTLMAELGRLNVLPEIAGIIVQMPLPAHLSLSDVIEVLSPSKDVDGIHPMNVGCLDLGLDAYVPATPAGGMQLLDHYGIPLEGKRALVIGRSSIVGKPLAQLLLARHATVTVAHSRSRDLPDLVSEADIVAAAVGRAGLVRGGWLKGGAAVLDFGASMVDGKMTGDIEYAAALGVAGAITPVPGGTGPMTNAILLRNTLRAIKRALA